MDFGIRSPTVVLWAEVDAAGVLRVIDERIVKDEVLDRHVEAILASRWGLPLWIGIDPAGQQRNDQTGVSSAQVLHAAGLKVKARQAGVQPGVAMVRARLAPADGSPPRLYVHDRCRGLIRSLETYRYDARRPLNVEPLKNGPDHAADALRYLVVSVDEAWEGRSGRYA